MKTCRSNILLFLQNFIENPSLEKRGEFDREFNVLSNEYMHLKRIIGATQEEYLESLLLAIKKHKDDKYTFERRLYLTLNSKKRNELLKEVNYNKRNVKKPIDSIYHSKEVKFNHTEFLKQHLTEKEFHLWVCKLEKTMALYEPHKTKQSKSYDWKKLKIKIKELYNE